MIKLPLSGCKVAISKKNKRDVEFELSRIGRVDFAPNDIDISGYLFFDDSMTYVKSSELFEDSKLKKININRNSLEYFYLVLAEECGELVEDILLGKDSLDEAIDIISVFKMIQMPESIRETSLISIDDLALFALNLQHLIFKGKRFGFFKKNPLTFKRPIDEIVSHCNSLEQYVLSKIEDLDVYYQKINNKQSKVIALGGLRK